MKKKKNGLNLNEILTLLSTVVISILIGMAAAAWQIFMVSK